MNQAEKRSILITGCSSGIGYHCARALAQRGWQVVASAGRPEDVKGLAGEGLAAVQLDLVTGPRLGADELDDLVALTAHGRIGEPKSDLAAHVESHRGRLLDGPDHLVHWLRRLVFRGAWIDQQVADGTLVPEFDEARGFRYRSAATGQPAAEEAPMPNWSQIAYRGTGG